jgi:hypothetical protein
VLYGYRVSRNIQLRKDARGEHDMTPHEELCIRSATQRWVRRVVVGLELCPFARREVEGDRVRYAVTDATSPEDLLRDLGRELARLGDDAGIETTLLVHPFVLGDFLRFNDFLDDVDALLAAQGWVGEIQVASFHPAYRFAGTDETDAANFTNRSPYPMLHLLREASVERAVAAHPDIEHVPERNVALLRRLGLDGLRRLGVPSPSTRGGESPASRSDSAGAA